MVAYDGALNLPSGFDYGGAGLWVDPATNRIYGSNIDGGQETLRVGRSTIPSIGGTGSQVGSFVNAVTSQSSGLERLSGGLLYNGKFYYSSHGQYDPDGSQNSSRNWITLCDPDLTNMGQINRMQPDKNGFVRGLAGVFMVIPQAWRTILGGPVATLCFQGSPINTSCPGFGMGIFDPEDVQRTTADVPVTVAFMNDNNAASHRIQPDSWWTGPGTEWFSVNDVVCGAMIPEGSRSLLFFSVHGTGSGNGCRQGSSTDTGPYEFRVTAYDMQDVVDSLNGVVDPWTPFPYANWLFTPGDDSGPFSNCVDIRWPVSCVNGDKFYCAERFIQDDGIHQWTINGLS